ncbi:hypothetical protein EB796_004081 [Bugula neritina]|uniref:RAB37 n=1 Tax=Bugula neritina TaxID=10212 RepID=A0A7J7KJ37_BUGNE|nr:hypothetical protein EB796_004081 [Bugula neritina]
MESSSNEHIDYVFKVVLIGDCGVGKSSLLLRYSDDFFQESYLCTIGVDLRIRTISVDDKRVKLQMWDTAGQERFKTLCGHYYRGAEAIIIVFDVTSENSFSNVLRWYEEARQLSRQDTVLVLLGNKSDMADSRAVSTERAQSLAASLNIAYFESSAKLCDNVKETFTATTRKMMEAYQKHHRAHLPDDLTNSKSLHMSQPIKSSTSLNCFDCSIM